MSKRNMKDSKGETEAANRRRTDNTWQYMTKMTDKGANDRQNITQKNEDRATRTLQITFSSDDKMHSENMIVEYPKIF